MVGNYACRFVAGLTVCLAGLGCQPPSGVQVQDRAALLRYLHRAGFDMPEYGRVSQDGTGKAVYVTDPTNSRCVMIQKDDPMPRDVTPPPARVVQWSWLAPDGVRHPLPRYAMSTESDVITTIDPQSGFFLQRRMNAQTAFVGTMTGSADWLFQVDDTDTFRATQICAAGRAVYLLDHRDRSNPAITHFQTNCWVFSRAADAPGAYLKVDEFSVPGIVWLADPFSARFICNSYGDMPFVSPPFVYDAKKHRKVCDLGFGSIALFLDGDWLGPRTRDAVRDVD